MNNLIAPKINTHFGVTNNIFAYSKKVLWLHFSRINPVNPEQLFTRVKILFNSFEKMSFWSRAIVKCMVYIESKKYNICIIFFSKIICSMSYNSLRKFVCGKGEFPTYKDLMNLSNVPNLCRLYTNSF